ncbi:MAG: serine/threonine protein kinase [Deltaproteobacteria bacterium]|nr:serine/threonine protein kinase [Deltaproteobacteria bacterium]
MNDDGEQQDDGPRGEIAEAPLPLRSVRAGRLVTGAVRLLRPLGEGAMGSVWVAEHTGLGTEVAVKFISGRWNLADPEIVARFHNEARAAARIKSPHVVQIHDHGLTEDGTPYIVMELLEGESLAERLDREGRLDLATATRIVEQVARALGRAHELGIVHRDLKPDNIFLCKSLGARGGGLRVPDGASRLRRRLARHAVCEDLQGRVGAAHGAAARAARASGRLLRTRVRGRSGGALWLGEAARRRACRHRGAGRAGQSCRRSRGRAAARRRRHRGRAHARHPRPRPAAQGSGRSRAAAARPGRRRAAVRLLPARSRSDRAGGQRKRGGARAARRAAAERATESAAGGALDRLGRSAASPARNERIRAAAAATHF